MNRKIRNIILMVSAFLLIAAAGIIAKFYAANNSCKRIEIILDNTSEGFISENEVRELILSGNDSLIGHEISEINIESIEAALRANPYILSARTYLTLDGTLKVEIDRRTAIARVQNIFNSIFYISDDGRLMPVKDSNAQMLLFVNGNITELYWQEKNLKTIADTISSDTLRQLPVLNKLYYLAKYICSDEFLNAQVQQIYVESQNNFILVPEVGKHIIIFGDINDMDQKFKKLKIFYRKAQFFEVWDKYDTINLKYKDQVICS